MTLNGWENWGITFYWIPVLVIVFVFGLIAYLVEKKPEKLRRQKEKERGGRVK
jgi:ABC-type multidrug transport system permease subunit